jgi:hypothetical protein
MGIFIAKWMREGKHESKIGKQEMRRENLLENIKGRQMKQLHQIGEMLCN